MQQRRALLGPSGLLRLVLGLRHGFDHAAQSLWRRNDSKLWTIDATDPISR
jgi:hypothetical protein